ncbi:uncharacterized protein [Diadema antillarum]|uniref:uncharacterized protein n=2 Tax=Diadema antillarum TaxID=105358 RepID=UPI003A8868B7
MRSNREIRIAIYSGFIGMMIALILLQVYMNRSYARRLHSQERARKQEERFRDIADCVQMRAHTPCPAVGQPQNLWEVCPQCPDRVFALPESLHQFVDDHMRIQRGSPLIIAKVQGKGLPSFYLSTHPKEKDEETNHLLSGHTSWQDKTLVRFCNLMKNAPDDGLFVDVGAYVGTIAMGVAKCGYSVVAFEPFPQNFRMLQESAALNMFDTDRVLLYNMALGNRTGKVCLVASSSDQSNAKIPPSGKLTSVICNNGKVPIGRLDEVVKQLPVFILHIDVRGFEPAVIAGAERLLSGKSPPKYLMFTVHQGYSKGALGIDKNFAEILDWLRKIGYKLKDSKHNSIDNGRDYLSEIGFNIDYVNGVLDKT